MAALDHVEIERTSQDVLTVRHLEPIRAGWESWHLLQADGHTDSVHFVKKGFVKHLEQAVERRAPVYHFGDLSDAMQGPRDPRGSPSSIIGEFADRDDYFDALVDYQVTLLGPYREHVALLTEGNHETKPQKYYGTNLTKRVSHALGCQHMGWAGWVRFMFSGKSGKRTSKYLYFMHGGGGDPEVTQGVIRTNRRTVYIPDAHMICSGHIHRSYLVPMTRYRINSAGRTHFDTQWHMQIPSYKQEFTPAGGYHMEKERSPRPIGAWWLHFLYNEDAPGRIEVEPIYANALSYS